MKIAKFVLASVILISLFGTAYARVGPDINSSRTPAAFSRPEVFKKGDQVEVEWQGEWWEAVIIEARCDLYKVHYTGFDNSWDEWVERQRVRGTGKRGSGKSRAGRGALPPGVDRGGL